MNYKTETNRNEVEETMSKASLVFNFSLIALSVIFLIVKAVI